MTSTGLSTRTPVPTALRGTLAAWHDGLLALLLLLVTAAGLLLADLYVVSPGVREDFPDVMRGQDVVTLLSVPVLLVSAHRARSGSLAAHLVRLGLLLYYAYSYVIYAFSPYNDAFLAYLAIVGLSVVGLLDGLFRLDTGAIEAAVDAEHSRGTGAFLVGVGALFVLLWLSMTVPALLGDGLPAGRVTYDIPSAVHILDLSMVLPLVIATGILLWRHRPIGVVLGIVVLCKITTLGSALLAMNLLFTDDANVGETALWGVITAVAVLLVVRLARKVGTPAQPWLHGSVWR